MSEDRRERYRALLERFNPTSQPELAIDSGLIVEDAHRSHFKTLAAFADLEPGGQQILVGGIGSGKSTQLLLAKRLLKAGKYSYPLYIDVSRYTDVPEITSDALIASLGIRLLNEPRLKEESPDFASMEKALKQYAYGRERVESSFPQVPPRLLPPGDSIDEETRAVIPILRQALATVSGTGREVVVLLDGLDSVTAPDLAVLKRLSVGVIAAAPLSIVGPQVEAMVDSVLYLPTVDYKASNFLREVLVTRGCDEAFSTPALDLTCRYSGGVLRDLMTLSRSAIVNAYSSERDHVEMSDVEAAARNIGSGYYMGLGSEQIRALMDLRDGGPFLPNSAVHAELIASGRLLQYEGPPPRYAVHPTLAQLLNG